MAAEQARAHKATRFHSANRQVMGGVIVEAVLTLSILTFLAFAGVAISRQLLVQQQMILAVNSSLPATLRIISGLAGTTAVAPADLRNWLNSELNIAIRATGLIPSTLASDPVTITDVWCQKYAASFATPPINRPFCEFFAGSQNPADRLVLRFSVNPQHSGFLGLGGGASSGQVAFPFPVR